MTLHHRALLIGLALTCLTLCSIAQAQETTPLRLTERVNDLAGVLSSSDRESIASELKSYEDSTSNQFVVLVVPSLNGEPIEQFALRTAQESGIGRDDKDNGLLLVVAIAERKIRIEVGYGLEGVLPDVLTAQIREREITPQFKAGNYAEGIRQGMRALMAAAAGEYVGSANTTPFYEKEDGDGIDWFFLAVVFGPFIFVGLIIFLALHAPNRGGHRGSSSSSYDAGTTWSSDSSSWSSSDSSSSSSSDSSFSGGGGDFGGGGSTGDW